MKYLDSKNHRALWELRGRRYLPLLEIVGMQKWKMHMNEEGGFYILRCARLASGGRLKLYAYLEQRGRPL